MIDCALAHACDPVQRDVIAKLITLPTVAHGVRGASRNDCYERCKGDGPRASRGINKVDK